MRREDQTESIIYVDHAPPHKKAIFTDALADYGIGHKYIPARMTGLVQPADVCWLKTIKNEYQKRWANWYFKIEKLLL